jgi:hypothetical protein
MISDVNAGNLKIINQHIATLEKKTLSAAVAKQAHLMGLRKNVIPKKFPLYSDAGRNRETEGK